MFWEFLSPSVTAIYKRDVPASSVLKVFFWQKRHRLEFNKIIGRFVPNSRHGKVGGRGMQWPSRGSRRLEDKILFVAPKKCVQSLHFVVRYFVHILCIREFAVHVVGQCAWYATRRFSTRLSYVISQNICKTQAQRDRSRLTLPRLFCIIESGTETRFRDDQP